MNEPELTNSPLYPNFEVDLKIGLEFIFPNMSYHRMQEEQEPRLYLPAKLCNAPIQKALLVSTGLTQTVVPITTLSRPTATRTQQEEAGH